MKRTEAEEAIMQDMRDDPLNYQDFVEACVAETISSWDDEQLAEFLWGDEWEGDPDNRIEPD